METKKAGRKGESFDLFVAENELIRTLDNLFKDFCTQWKNRFPLIIIPGIGLLLFIR